MAFFIWSLKLERFWVKKVTKTHYSFCQIIDHMTPEAIVTRCSKITVLESTMFNVENVGEFCTEDALQVSLML